MHFACRNMQQDTHTRKGKDSPAYLDPQMMMMTVIQTEKVEVMKYLVRAMCYYKDKTDMLIVPYNTGSHWVLLTISMRHNQVWYYDSNRSIDPATASERPVITVRSWLPLTSKFILHFSFFIISSLHDNFALMYKYNVSV
jgi:hypothetical protein